ncbi:MAG: 23S rRNA (guanosine(2251)-2'-O)-methyltransferase RlmB [Proteobacteria bacterium]|nr:23S rRNA (guanosine(2251)-2'-O)-methyltransferase RlmB [Pseudomonadota bacterium]
MSKEENEFRPRPRRGGQRVGDKSGAHRRDRRDRDSGDRPKRNRGDRSTHNDSRPYAKRDKGDFERREFSNHGSRPPRDRQSGDKRRTFGDRKPFGKDKRDNRPQKRFKRYDERPAHRGFSGHPSPSGPNENRSPANVETLQKLKSSRPTYGPPSSAYLYGIHTVTQALLNPQRVHKRLLCTQKAHESIQETWAEAQEDGIALPEVITVEKEDIERLLPRDAVHQDILLDCQPLEETSLHELLLTIPEDAKILVLDQVTDPHNVGAILRSAAAFGAKAVVVQTLHAPEITGVLAKSASGALEHVPMVREVNLSRALEQLKKAGFFCIGLAEEGKQTLAQLKLTGKIALVLGAEGAGLRRLVAENCDELAQLPTQGPIGSLNVSNAATVSLYELNRK